MKRKLVIGFLKATDPNDQTTWSGISYQMLKSLENTGLKVISLGPVKQPKFLNISLRIVNRLHLFIYNKRFNKDHNILLSKYYAKQFNKRLKNKRIDVVFAPSASTELAYLKTSIPVCYLSGTSFNQIKNYYSYYDNLSQSSLKESDSIEQRAIENSTTQVYPSDWAAKHVIEYYKADSNNVFVIPYGANLNCPPNKDIIEKKEYKLPIKLLFLGVDWERKGGDLVYDTLNILLERNYNISLTVCGCIPPKTHPKMTVIPFLNKNLDADSKKFTKLLSESHILFLPTRSECFGVVFCEAAAFGLAIITTNTGGVGSIVEQGINGYALSLASTAIDYAEKIQLLLDDPGKLKNMGLMSRDKFDDELNWEEWAKKMKNVFIETINKHSLHNKR